jgi:predicted RNA-binding protein with PIN domain
MAKVLGLKQFSEKKFTFLDPLPDEIVHCFGRLTHNFTMTVWGDSGNGKTNLNMQFVKALMPHGKVLYISLEEGFEASMQLTILRNLDVKEHSGKIEFADHEMTADELMKKLAKKKSPRFIIVDSLQYWNIRLPKYKELKEKFIKKKTLIFISHAKGKKPDGYVADKIRYDSAIKVYVEGYVAFVKSRLGGNNPYVIWEEGAKKYWGKEYKSKINRMQKKLEKSMDEKPKAQTDESSQADQSIIRSMELKTDSHEAEPAHT